MGNFCEETFIYALASRPEDSRKFAQTFKPEWLDKTEYVPILSEIFSFTKKQTEPPSLNTLHKIFKDRDPDAYKLRYQSALSKIESSQPDNSGIIYTLGQAKDVAVVRSFAELTNSQAFIKTQLNLDGSNLLGVLHSWFNRFGETTDDKTLDLKQAVEFVIDSHGFLPKVTKIPCGISVIDEWTNNGLRTKQLGIIMAPTGHGKSACLVVMAQKIAAIERRRVWFVTNELTMEQTTERFLAKITGKNLSHIIDDPGIAYKNLSRHWKSGLHDRLRLTEVNREISVNDLESEMLKWVNLMGWKPDVLILDFMERMKPCDSGHRRDKEWVWLQAISQDLFRFAKRHNVLVWTACQTNRSGLKANDLDMSMGQGSIRHFQEAAVVIAMNQVESAYDENTVYMKFKPLKMRESRRAPRAVTLECDLSKMNISNVVVEDGGNDYNDREPEGGPVVSEKNIKGTGATEERQEGQGNSETLKDKLASIKQSLPRDRQKDRQRYPQR